MVRIFFCLNQVSYIVASEAAKRLPGFNLLIVMPGRVRVHPHSSGRSVRYRAPVAAVVLALSCIMRKVEVALPHTKAAGRLTRWMSRFSRNLSYVDDGMDTFRDSPRNIELNLVRVGAKYYTFDYGASLADWLGNVCVAPVCPVNKLADDPKPAMDLSDYDALVIESPGVDLSKDFSGYGKVFYFKHPNRTKSQGMMAGSNSESGANYSIEKTILNFGGSVLIGETMVLIFALLCTSEASRIHVFLSDAQYRNLRSIHPLLERCGSVTVS